MQPIIPKIAVRVEALARAALPAFLTVAFSAVSASANAADNAPAAATAEKAVTAKSVDERKQRIEWLARREGYRPIVRDGERLYCKEEAVTASRVQKQRTCVAEDQIELHLDLEKDTAREVLDRGLRGFTPRDP